MPREATRRAITVAEAVELYLADFEKRADSGAKRGRRSSYEEAKRLLEAHVEPALGAIRLRGVTVEHVQRLHRSMKDTPSAANRAIAALPAVYGFADRRQLVPAHFNPCRHVESFEEKGERLTKMDRLPGHPPARPGTRRHGRCSSLLLWIQQPPTWRSE